MNQYYIYPFIHMKVNDKKMLCSSDIGKWEKKKEFSR